MKKPGSDKTCPCGSGLSYEACCAPLIREEQSAESAEALMRSRYTAYTEYKEAYILSTWHTSTRPKNLSINIESPLQWIRLKVIQSSYDTVEFIAWYKLNGKAHKLHEHSRFIYENQRWYYIDGDPDPAP